MSILARQTRLLGYLLLFGVLTAAHGCGDSGSSSPPTMTVTDAAGTRIVRLSSFSVAGLPEFRVRRLFSTSSLGGEKVELFQVMDALFLPDSSLVIANYGTSQLLHIDKHGENHSWIGRDGDGPGEFRRLRRLVPRWEGGFYAFDYRLSSFDIQGRFLETRPLNPGSLVVSVLPLAVLRDGRAVAVLGEQRIFLGEERRDTVPLLIYPEGAGSPDTLGTWMGLERSFARVPGGSLRVPIGFARTAFAASNGSRIAIGSTDSLDITVFSEELTPILRILCSTTHRRPTGTELRQWRENMDGVSLLNDLSNEEVRRAWDNARVRETLPDWEGLAVDDLGRIWIGEYPGLRDRERNWILFDVEGTPIGFVRLPRLPWRRHPGTHELQAVAEDRMAILRLKHLDEPRVEVWTFRLPH